MLTKSILKSTIEGMEEILKKKKKYEKNQSRNLVGCQFGGLTVVSRSGSKDGASLWQCICECGADRFAKASDLKLGKTVSCGCRRRGSKSHHFSGYKNITSHYWGHVIINARNRNIEFNITKEYAWDLFELQNRKCALSGIDIDLCDSPKLISKNQTASIDRIDSNIGYIVGNIQWVHKDINKMKNAHSQSYFIYLCKLIAERNL